MLIRCPQCQAVFSLQDGAAAGAGSFKVECGRCLQVFEAAAPPQTPPPAQTPPPPQTPPPAVPGAAGPQASRPGGLRPEARRLKPALPLAAALLLALALFAAARAHLASAARARQARMQEAREKLLRDDTRSLQEAAALFTAAARLSPGEAAPEGERAFALLLLGGTHLALGDHGELRFLQEGFAAARAALEDDAEDAAALRALALHAALTGAIDQGAAPLDRAARRAPADPWVSYTRAALLRAGPPSREREDAALSALAAARQAEPRMLRAQVEVAAISVERGETGPARLELTQVLRQNPEHERAQRLLASLPPP